MGFYFALRGDPVGFIGQAVGALISMRNLWLLNSGRRTTLLALFALIIAGVFEVPAALLSWLYSITQSFAFAISLIAVLVMLVVTPLILKSTKGMLEMQRLAPEMRKLQQEYKSDRQQLNQEMMKLYQEHKVNPMASCLPMLAQMPVFFIMFSSLPLGWLLFRRRQRFAKFATQLPDALELVGRALRSGHSLASGLHVVVEEMPAPISTEFAMVYESQNLGIPIEQALKDMLRRMPNMDLKFFVTSVVIQRQTGGDLAEILDKIGHIIRERFRILGQVQALTGEGRISGVVLMGLPIALFFAVYHLNPSYVMLLFTDPLGRKMIAGAAFLQVLGAVTIKKIVNIKV